MPVIRIEKLLYLLVIIYPNDSFEKLRETISERLQTTVLRRINLIRINENQSLARVTTEKPRFHEIVTIFATGLLLPVLRRARVTCQK